MQERSTGRRGRVSSPGRLDRPGRPRRHLEETRRIAWNVFQHFYPYFDVVDTDWPKVLTESIRRTIEAADEQSFQGALQLLLVELHDGHAGVERTVAAGGEGRDEVLEKAVERIGAR